MEFVEKALLRQLAYERGMLTEDQTEITHTQITKAKKIEDNILKLKGQIINHFIDRYGDISIVNEGKILAAIKVVTNKRDDRTARNWLDLLLEKGLFRRVIGGNIAILEQLVECKDGATGRKIVTATVKVEDDIKAAFAGYPLVGDLR